MTGSENGAGKQWADWRADEFDAALRDPDRWFVLLVFAGCAVVAGLGLQAWYRRPLGIVLEGTSLLLSPHGRAPAVAPVEGGTTVRILVRSPGWALVRAPGAREGWLSEDAIAALGG